MTAASFTATLENLEPARSAMLRALPEEWLSLGPKIELALDELWANIVNHAYEPGRPGRIEVEGRALELEGRPGFLVRLRDWGPPFDSLTEAPAPDLEADLASRPIGGLGIYLVKTLARRYTYHRLEDGNLVELFFNPGD